MVDTPADASLVIAAMVEADDPHTVLGQYDRGELANVAIVAVELLKIAYGTLGSVESLAAGLRRRALDTIANGGDRRE